MARKKLRSVAKSVTANTAPDIVTPPQPPKAPVKKTSIPNADADLSTAATAMAEEWKNNPTFTLLWMTLPHFQLWRIVLQVM